jgi:hypothetical protein
MEYGIIVGSGTDSQRKGPAHGNAMGQCDVGGCMRFARGFVGTHYLGVASRGSRLRRLVECYDVHVKGVVREIHTVQSGGVEERLGASLYHDLCGAGSQSFHAPPRVGALSAIAFVAFVLSLGWCLYAAESPGVDVKWAQAQRQAAHQAIPDDYVERLLTLVLQRAGATDTP